MDFSDYADRARSGTRASTRSRALTVSGALGPPDDLFGWRPIESDLVALVGGALGSSINAFCPAVVDHGWRDGAYANYADVAVLDVSISDKTTLLDRLRRTRIFAIVTEAPQTMSRATIVSQDDMKWWGADLTLSGAQAYLVEQRKQPVVVEGLEEIPGDIPALRIQHTPLPVFRIFLPLKKTFYFFDCCSTGKFESLAAWHEMLCEVAAKLHVSLTPGDTSPVRSFALGEPQHRSYPQTVPGALIDPADWLEPQDGPLVEEAVH